MVKNLLANARDARDTGSIPGSERFPVVCKRVGDDLVTKQQTCLKRKKDSPLKAQEASQESEKNAVACTMFKKRCRLHHVQSQETKLLTYRDNRYCFLVPVSPSHCWSVTQLSGCLYWASDDGPQEGPVVFCAGNLNCLSSWLQALPTFYFYLSSSLRTLTLLLNH